MQCTLQHVERVKACLVQEPSFYTAKQLYTRVPPLSTHSSQLDGLLGGGGLPVGTLLELSGPPGSGKTQLCLQWTAEALKQGHTVLYLDTEGAFPPERLVQLYSGDAHLHRLHLYRIHTPYNMLAMVHKLESIVLEKQPRLILVDSLAQPFWRVFDTLRKRNKVLRLVGTKLQAIVHAHATSIVVTNHVMSKLASQATEQDTILETTLGDYWSRACSMRIGLFFFSQGKAHGARLLSCAWLPERTIHFVIGEGGVKDCEEPP